MLNNRLAWITLGFLYFVVKLLCRIASAFHKLRLQSALPRRLLVLHRPAHTGGKVSERIDTGSVLVTRENLGRPEIHELLNPDLSKWLK